MTPGQRRDPKGRQVELRAETAERLEAIVEAAERAAEKVIDDAEAQAHRHLAEAKAEADRAADDRLADLGGLIDSLVGQAASLRQEAECLQGALEEAQSRLGGGGTTPAAERPREVEEPAEPQPPKLRAVAEASPAPADDRDRAAGARLLATQLAVSGSSREEIEARLRTGFEVEDTSAILDAILGPED